MVIYEIFNIKNCNFKNFVKAKYDPNIHQKCTILKNFLWVACPRTPLAKRMSLRDMQISKPKKIFLPPPCQILATPLHTYVQS